MNNFLQDLKFGVRMLLKHPAFASIGILTLALGVGANSAMFTVVNALMLKMLPVRAPEQLIIVGSDSATNSVSDGTPRGSSFSYPLFREFAADNPLFESVFAAASLRDANVKIRDASVDDKAQVRLVTGSYFHVLGIEAALGRTFDQSADNQRGGSPIVVISDRYWKNQFASAPNVIGRTIRVNDYPMTIVGVLPVGFLGDIVGDESDLWVPLIMQEQLRPGRKYLDNLHISWLQVMGRAKPGVTVKQVEAWVNPWFQSLLSGLFSQLDAGDKRTIAHTSIQAHDGSTGFSAIRAAFSKPLTILLGIVALILLIACVNIANLLMARLRSREKEIAVRLAIGARASRIVRQFLTESLLLASLGGILGLLLSRVAVRMLFRVSLQSATTPLDTSLDWHVLAFTIGVCTLATLLFGLAPALRAVHSELLPTLQQGARGSSVSKWGIGKFLVAAQIAISILVLFASGLLLRTLQKLQSFDLGYERSHLLVVSIDPVRFGYKENAAIDQLASTVVARFNNVPGVESASVSDNGLFSGSESADAINVPGFQASDQDRITNEDLVGANYFSTVHIPVVIGREIGAQDTSTAPRVAVVNETFVKHFFRGVNPIGRTFGIEDVKGAENIEIVGVVKDVYDHEVREVPHPRAYYPITQPPYDRVDLKFIVRTKSDPALILETMRKVIKEQDPALQVASARTLDELVQRTFRQQKSLAQMSTFFSGLALLLASIGLYGVMSYSVAGRTRELGIRFALGAQRTTVLLMVIRETLLVVIIGVGVGVPVAIAAGRALQSILFELSVADPVSLILSTSVLTTVAVLAGYIPAHRAASVDPVIALRSE